MAKSLLLLTVFLCFAFIAKSQSITVDDLVTLSSVSSKNIDNYLGKKGFVTAGRMEQDNALSTTFIESKKTRSKDTSGIIRRVNHYSKENADYFILQTTSIDEFNDGNSRLKKTGFSCGDVKGPDAASPLCYRKNNLTISADTKTEDGVPVYTFLLEKKEKPNPKTIRFAEDLLTFDSHQFLVSYFGQKNVKEDVYYFSEKELKKCSVLFPNTSQQATFIWDDEKSMSKLSYVLISGILPTEGALKFSSSVSENKWQLKNGIYANMSIKELYEVNEADFEFYGVNSEFSYMVVPGSKGAVDFSKIGITFGCFDCSSSPLLEKKKITASEAIKHSLTIYVVYIMIMPQ